MVVPSLALTARDGTSATVPVRAWVRFRLPALSAIGPKQIRQELHSVCRWRRCSRVQTSGELSPHAALVYPQRFHSSMSLELARFGSADELRQTPQSSRLIFRPQAAHRFFLRQPVSATRPMGARILSGPSRMAQRGRQLRSLSIRRAMWPTHPTHPTGKSARLPSRRVFGHACSRAISLPRDQEFVRSPERRGAPTSGPPPQLPSPATARHIASGPGGSRPRLSSRPESNLLTGRATVRLPRRLEPWIPTLRAPSRHHATRGAKQVRSSVPPGRCRAVYLHLLP